MFIYETQLFDKNGQMQKKQSLFLSGINTEHLLPKGLRAPAEQKSNCQ